MDFAVEDVAGALAIIGMGTRSRKVVSENALSFSETVRVTAGATEGPIFRSALEARFTEDTSADEPGETGG